MKSYEIIYAMGDAMTAKQLEHELRPYIDVNLDKVCAYILEGVEGYTEKVIAFVLGLKKYIPAGWEPVKRVIAVKLRRKLPKQYTFGNMGFQGRKGTAHYKNQGRFWQEDDIIKLKLLHQTMACHEIAKAMGKTYNSVQSKISHMKKNGTL